MKYHINPETGRVNQCSAQIQCKFKLNDSEHVYAGTSSEARRIYDDKIGKQVKDSGKFLKTKNENTGASRNIVIPARPKIHNTSNPDVVLYNGKKMPKREAKLAEITRRSADNIIAERYKENLIVDSQESNKDKAMQRLAYAVDYADKRNNPDLVEKISKAKVFAESQFTVEHSNGEKESFKMDDIIETGEKIKYLDKARENYERLINNYIKEKNIPTDYSFKYTDEETKNSYSLKVTDGKKNDSYLDSLPDNVKEHITDSSSSISIDTLRDADIPEEIKKQIIYRESVADYILNESYLDTSHLDNTLDFGNDDDYTKGISTAMEQLAKNQIQANKEFGSPKTALNKQYNNQKSIVKRYVGENSNNKDKNIYVPTRGAKNGMLLSGREKVNPAKAKELLGDKYYQYAKPTTVYSEEKAKKALEEGLITKEVYDKGFNNKAVQLRFTEKN